MSYRYLDNLATADVAFEASGDSPERLFESAGRAVMNVMVEDLESIRPERCIGFELSASGLDILLFKYLQEVIFYKDAEMLLLVPQTTEIQGGYAGGGAEDFGLKAQMCGEEIDLSRHRMLVDVKAVTLHHFELTQSEGQWKATVVLDI